MDHPADLSAPQPSALAPQQAGDLNPLDQRLQMGRDMGGGASGGPMIKNFTGSAQIVGVNSHRYTDSSGGWLDNRLFSSEHGAHAVTVYKAVR
ncbi:hypothetical protein [Streptomyces sp. NRRL S-448]